MWILNVPTKPFKDTRTEATVASESRDSQSRAGRPRSEGVRSGPGAPERGHLALDWNPGSLIEGGTPSLRGMTPGSGVYPRSEGILPSIGIPVALSRAGRPRSGSAARCRWLRGVGGLAHQPRSPLQRRQGDEGGEAEQRPQRQADAEKGIDLGAVASAEEHAA